MKMLKKWKKYLQVIFQSTIVPNFNMIALFFEFSKVTQIFRAKRDLKKIEKTIAGITK